MKEKSKIYAAIIAILMMMGTTCEREELNDPFYLVNSKWHFESVESNMLLHFVNETECTISSGRNDGTYSANRTTYIWRYRTMADSWSGDIVLFKKNSDGSTGERAYIGMVKGPKLSLISAGTEIVDEITFKRTK